MALDRALLSPVKIRHLDRIASWARNRREYNRSNGLCVNDNKGQTHGKPTHGVRCDACHATHMASR